MQIVLDIFLFIVYLSLFLLMLAWLWKFWSMYVSQKFMSGMNFVLLEIKLPREIFKSPEAMEIAANAFLQSGGVAQWYKRNWLGNVVTFFSLEIASIEGDVRFYIRCEKKFKDLVTNNMYSQYPGIEIKEAEDYVTKMFYDHRHKNTSVWGLTNKLGESFTLPKTPGTDREGKKDAELKVPADFRMIKTYVDYKQDKDPKEEFEHDPLTPVLEWLGSMGKGEHAWYQLILQDSGKFNGKTFPATYHCEATHEQFTLKELADERRKQIRSRETPPAYKKGDKVFDDYGYPVMMKVPDGVDDEGKPQFKEVQKEYQKDGVTKSETLKEVDLTEEAKDELKMITRKLQKTSVRAALRVMYLTEKDKGDFGSNVQSTLSIFKQYNGPGYNSFIPNTSDNYDYAWEDTMKRRKPWRGEEMFEAYVEREAFYPHIPDRAKPTSMLGKFFFGYGVDSWADLALFKYSLGTRKIIRMMYEGFFDPFGHPHPDTVFTLNLEEVASLWHLPGTVATTPGIRRVDSIKSDAPDNLPR